MIPLAKLIIEKIRLPHLLIILLPFLLEGFRRVGTDDLNGYALNSFGHQVFDERSAIFVFLTLAPCWLQIKSLKVRRHNLDGRLCHTYSLYDFLVMVLV